MYSRPGTFFAPLGEGEEARHPSRLAFERADVVSDVAINDAVLLPLPHDLGIEGILSGIEVGPQFLDRAGSFRLVGGKSRHRDKHGNTAQLSARRRGSEDSFASAIGGQPRCRDTEQYNRARFVDGGAPSHKLKGSVAAKTRQTAGPDVGCRVEFARSAPGDARRSVIIGRHSRYCVFLRTLLRLCFFSN